MYHLLIVSMLLEFAKGVCAMYVRVCRIPGMFYAEDAFGVLNQMRFFDKPKRLTRMASLAGGQNFTHGWYHVVKVFHKPRPKGSLSYDVDGTVYTVYQDGVVKDGDWGDIPDAGVIHGTK